MTMNYITFPNIHISNNTPKVIVNNTYLLIY